MDEQRWADILARINAKPSDWKLTSKELRASKKEFASGGGVLWSNVQELRETWRSLTPFIDSDGSPFVLYIYSQGIPGAKHHYLSHAWEYKFHFSWCATLVRMEADGRRARYKAKYDVDNDIFTINRGFREEKRRLKVCKNCLSEMDYDSYNRVYGLARDRICDEFNIKDFFEQYAPPNLLRPTHQLHTGMYPADWPAIAKRIKNTRGNRCEANGPHGGGLHVHHVNGVKDDCRPTNLQVLCYDCHARQPGHTHMLRLARR